MEYSFVDKIEAETRTVKYNRHKSGLFMDELNIYLNKEWFLNQKLGKRIIRYIKNNGPENLPRSFADQINAIEIIENLSDNITIIQREFDRCCWEKIRYYVNDESESNVC